MWFAERVDHRVAPLIVLDACERSPLAYVLENTTRLCQSVGLCLEGGC